MHTTALILATVATAFSTSTAAAQMQPFLHPDGTTHWYQAVVNPLGIDWDDANVMAARAGGYLATIESPQENTFVFGLVDDPALWHRPNQRWEGPWIGGLQAHGSTEPAGGWRWANLDAFSFAAWNPSQPDDKNRANRVHFGGSLTGPTAEWSDGLASQPQTGFVIEFSGAFVPTTVGLRRHDQDATEGYTLLNPRFSKTTYLLGLRGRIVHTFHSPYFPGMVDYLLENGSLLRAGFLDNQTFPDPGTGGVVQEIDWDSNPVWKFEYSSTTHCLHHDIERLPNGNVLAIAWEMITAQQAIDAGRDPGKLADNMLWPDKIIEIEPDGQGGGAVVWEWRAWDHLVQEFDNSKPNYAPIQNHPERIDLNYEWDGNPKADWMHSNAVAYNAKLDQIMLCVRDFNEVWILDHSTTTQEASGRSGGRSGKGGDLLYRWGNPHAYRSGLIQDQQLFLAHDAHWIEDGLPGAGNMLLFNNGRGRRIPHSSVDEIELPTPDVRGNYARNGGTWGPATPLWTYTHPTPQTFYAPFVSSAQRLASGNTLVCAGSTGWTFEVTRNGTNVWDHELGVSSRGVLQQGEESNGNIVFRARRYPRTHKAFAGRSLRPGMPIETYPAAVLIEGSRVPFQAKIGTRVSLSLIAGASQANSLFQFATSLTPGLTPIDHRFLHLGMDPLFWSTVQNGASSIFQNYTGKLDSQGRVDVWIEIPAMPVLAGLTLFTTAATVHRNAPTRVSGIANVVILRTQL